MTKQITECLKEYYSGARPDEANAIIQRLLQMYEEFRPYADTNFVQEFCSGDGEKLLRRYWEMYLANRLIEQGKSIEATKFGPDFKISENGYNVWIEATAPGLGSGPNRPYEGYSNPEFDENNFAFYEVPRKQLLLRWTGAINEKRKQFEGWRSQGLIGENDICVIAVNAYLLRYGAFEGLSEWPAALEAVYGIGGLIVNLDPEDLDVVETTLKYEPEVFTAAKGAVKTNIFLDNSASGISAVFAASRKPDHELFPAGRGLIAVHNMRAKNKLPRRYVGGIVDYWVEKVDSENYRVRFNGDEFAALGEKVATSAKAAWNHGSLDALRVRTLGKKGAITTEMKGLSRIEGRARKTIGQALNTIKNSANVAVETQSVALEAADLDQRLATERIDVTLPVRPEAEGRIHPISQCIDEVTSIFGEMGFTVAEGPDIETDWHNFTALNIPLEHPARQMHDTFYLAGPGPSRHTNPETGAGSAGTAGDGGVGGAADVARGNEDSDTPWVLRTHTSPVQVRTMEEVKPPIRILVPGRAYRSDWDLTHTPMFHQFEGLVIDKATHMGHLKGCLIEFCRAYFEIPDVPVRFRPSHFPFTEPSAEVDIGCSHTREGLKISYDDDWLEILGCGMVHPKVLANCGIDPEVYQGFAFGMGTERVAMLKYGIPDLRSFYDHDMRWLRHYGFVPLDVPSLTGGLGG